MTFEDNLKTGIWWEEAVVRLLRDYGYKAYRPCQHFAKASDWHKYQIDVVAEIGGREVNIEVKSSKAAFSRGSPFCLGRVSRWRERRYETHLLFIVNTRQAPVRFANRFYVTQVNNVKDFMVKEGRLYVPKSLATPFPTWIKRTDYDF